MLFSFHSTCRFTFLIFIFYMSYLYLAEYALIMTYPFHERLTPNASYHFIQDMSLGFSLLSGFSANFITIYCLIDTKHVQLVAKLNYFTRDFNVKRFNFKTNVILRFDLQFLKYAPCPKHRHFMHTTKCYSITHRQY